MQGGTFAELRNNTPMQATFPPLEISVASYNSMIIFKCESSVTLMSSHDIVFSSVTLYRGVVYQLMNRRQLKL